MTTPSPRHASALAGFSLIELLAALAIVALMLALALPAYREQVARGQRAAVQVALLEDAQGMQRYLAANNTYEGATDAGLPAPRSPHDGPPAYVLSVEATPPTVTAWWLVATPIGPMADDRCGQMTLDSLGRKGVVNGTGASVASCWR